MGENQNSIDRRALIKGATWAAPVVAVAAAAPMAAASESFSFSYAGILENYEGGTYIGVILDFSSTTLPTLDLSMFTLTVNGSPVPVVSFNSGDYGMTQLTAEFITAAPVGPGAIMLYGTIPGFGSNSTSVPRA